MIYYFSGTRNSRYATLRLGSLTGEEVRFIPAVDVYKEKIDEERDNSIGFVFPVYAWGVPPIVLDFISKLPETMIATATERKMPVWCVATCGDETGMAVEMLRKSLNKRDLTLKGAWSLIMPNVYVLLPGFGTDSDDVANKKLSDSVVRLREIAGMINANEWTEDVHRGGFPWIKTALIYPLFKKWGVDTSKWHSTDSCIGCGKCAKACPVGNIAMKNDHPEWGTDCTSCCACFHVCPTQSAQYGTITKGMGQFYNREKC